MRNIPDVVVGFDEYARAHLFSNVSRNSSALYAGFEAITDADAVAEVVGGAGLQTPATRQPMERQQMAAPIWTASLRALRKCWTMFRRPRPK